MRFASIGLTVLSLLVASSAIAQTPGSGDKRLKLRVAVAPLDWSSFEYFDGVAVPGEFRNAIYEKLTKKLLDTGRFIVLEREAMDALLNEKEIKEESTGQSQRGKIMPAQALVRGKVTDFKMNRTGTGGGIGLPGIGVVGGASTKAECALNVRIFNVDTSELLASEEAKGTASSNSFSIAGGIGSLFGSISTFNNSPLGIATTKAIDGAVDAIVKKLDKMPWACRVADYDEDSHDVTITAGTDSGVKVGDLFEVMRPGKVIKDPDTGEVLSVKVTKVGTIKVTDVEQKIATAIVADGEKPQTGDIVREIKG